MGLSKLRKSLLYNNLVDVWIALSEEKGLNWEDLGLYRKFLSFIKEQSIPIHTLPVCIYESGKKGMLAKATGAFFKEPKKTHVMRTDKKTIDKLRAFAPTMDGMAS